MVKELGGGDNLVDRLRLGDAGVQAGGKLFNGIGVARPIKNFANRAPANCCWYSWLAKTWAAICCRVAPAANACSK